MKKFFQGTSHGTMTSVIIGFLVLTSLTACNKWQDYLPDEVPDKPKFLPGLWSLTNALVSNNVAFKPLVRDELFVDARGFQFVKPGIVWATSHDEGRVSLYNVNFPTQGILKSIQVPSPHSTGEGKPAALVVNDMSSFKLSNRLPAKIIIGSTDGIISGWNDASGNSALVIKNNTVNAVYTGLATGKHYGKLFLFAANFKSGKIEVYDHNFNQVHSKKFTDPLLPKGFSPFNIYSVEDHLIVTYAKPAGDGEGVSEVGNGIINIFTTEGNHIKRFATKGVLNSPWGIATIPAGFFPGVNEPLILIANHGDGTLVGFSTQGKFLGQLQDSRGDVFQLEKIWGISFENPGPNSDTGSIVCSASPEGGGTPSGYLSRLFRE